jgi:hypothetical protein
MQRHEANAVVVGHGQTWSKWMKRQAGVSPVVHRQTVALRRHAGVQVRPAGALSPPFSKIRTDAQTHHRRIDKDEEIARCRSAAFSHRQGSPSRVREPDSNMPQNEHMELHRKRHGERMDAEERARKRVAREVHKRSEFAQKVHGIRAKLYHQKRFKEKATMKKT